MNTPTVKIKIEKVYERTEIVEWAVEKFKEYVIECGKDDIPVEDLGKILFSVEWVADEVPQVEVDGYGLSIPLAVFDHLEEIPTYVAINFIENFARHLNEVTYDRFCLETFEHKEFKLMVKEMIDYLKSEDERG